MTEDRERLDAATWLNMNRPVLSKQLGPWNDYIDALEDEFRSLEDEFRSRVDALVRELEETRLALAAACFWKDQFQKRARAALAVSPGEPPE